MNLICKNMFLPLFKNVARTCSFAIQCPDILRPD